MKFLDKIKKMLGMNVETYFPTPSPTPVILKENIVFGPRAYFILGSTGDRVYVNVIDVYVYEGKEFVKFYVDDTYFIEPYALTREDFLEAYTVNDEKSIPISLYPE